MRVAIVVEARRAAGIEARVRTWLLIGESLGWSLEVVRVPVRLPGPPVLFRRFGALVRGDAVLESLALEDVRSDTRVVDADLVLCVTTRVLPSIQSDRPAVLVDFVDDMSANYTGRGASHTSARAALYRLLALSHRRTQVRVAGQPRFVRTAAGAADAGALSAAWVPNVLDGGISCRGDSNQERQFEACFFGSLSYEPNVAALAWLNEYWTKLGISSLLVAGRKPSAEVRRWARDRRWTLVENFPSVDWLAAQAEVALFPLVWGTGFQNKALEAVLAGLPVVATSPVTAGMNGMVEAVPLEPGAMREAIYAARDGRFNGLGPGWTRKRFVEELSPAQVAERVSAAILQTDWDA